MDIFSPYGLDTTAVSVSSVTASGALNLPTAPNNPTVQVFNAATVTVFVQFGDSTVTSTTAKMPIPAGAVMVFQIGPSTTHIAGITTSGTGTLYATPGRGA